MWRRPRHADRQGATARHAMVAAGLLSAALCGAKSGLAQSPAPLLQDPVFARSHSGQFIVQGAVGLNHDPLTDPAAKAGLMRVNATLLPVSCERIKQNVWRDLGISGPWAGKVYLGLRPIRMPNEPITILREHFRDGWQYRLDLPDTVDRTRYVRAIVQVLLLELANRSASDRSADIPTWLVEGFVAHLLTAHDVEIILQPPPAGRGPLRFKPTVSDRRLSNPLEPVHEWFSTNQPLTFEELSWPTPDHYGLNVSDKYRSSSQLFVSGLMQLPNGQASLRKMIELLPHYHNWQFAFFAAFAGHFTRPLDVEKWWTLHVVHFTGRDLGQAWSVDESCQKLRETLRTPVEVHAGPTNQSQRSELALQTVIRTWEFEEQKGFLQVKMAELAQLRVRVTPGLAGLVDSYRATLEGYLQNREPSDGKLVRKKKAIDTIVEDTLRSLNTLDAQTAGFVSLRERARSLTNSAAPAPQQAFVGP